VSGSQGLESSVAIIVIISPGSLKSHWVPYEVGYATALRKKILPYLTHPSINPPGFLADLLHIKSEEQIRDFFSLKSDLNFLNRPGSLQLEKPKKDLVTGSLEDHRKEFQKLIKNILDARDEVPVTFLRYLSEWLATEKQKSLNEIENLKFQTGESNRKIGLAQTDKEKDVLLIMYLIQDGLIKNHENRLDLIIRINARIENSKSFGGKIADSDIMSKVIHLLELASQDNIETLPPLYRQCAIAYTDFWAAYGAVLPSKRHRAVGKETGKTSYIERFNNTLRQRVSRLVRKTLSFSKSLENHIGAIWYFIHHYNASLLV
jgi:insertion element IS1 protein InsB